MMEENYVIFCNYQNTYRQIKSQAVGYIGAIYVDIKLKALIFLKISNYKV